MVEEVVDEEYLNRPIGLGLHEPLLICILDEDEEVMASPALSKEEIMRRKYALMVEEVEDEEYTSRPKGLGLDEPLLMYIYDDDEEVLILPDSPSEKPEKMDEAEDLDDPLIFEYYVRPPHQRKSPRLKPTLAQRRSGVPQLVDSLDPTLHSSQTRRDSVGEEDPYGLNDVFIAAMHEHASEFSGRTNITKEDIPQLREAWFDRCADILSGVPLELPPLRQINHHIPLIDESKMYRYHMPRCADALKPLLLEKIKTYIKAQWWVEANVPQAAPMLCIPKKNGTLRTVIDLRQQNENLVRDVTPLPDQDQIRMDVARAKVRSKIDMSNAYEQIRVDPNDVWKTSFNTVYGTYRSQVMQQGDANAPATFQRLMTLIFRDYIGIFVHVYLDDIFVFSNSIEEHEQHLELVFKKLREAHLFLERAKCQLYAERMDCLGHIIDDQGLHADADKMQKIREWPVPKNYNEVQRFLGLVQYLAQFLPGISAYTSPLASITRNGAAFQWRPIHERCFQLIKAMACKAPILKPIDPSIDEPIWVVCDASVAGVGAWYGQGPTWETSRPAGFMSKKFSTAQLNYRVHEMETIAIMEALMKWEDKLLGRRINIVTDHESLQFFKKQKNMSSRQMRWMEFFSRFTYDIQYIDGDLNVVADAFSRYYMSEAVETLAKPHDYVNVDLRLDPGGEDLPMERWVEIRAIRTSNRKPVPRVERNDVENLMTTEAARQQFLAPPRTRQPRVPKEAVQPRDIEAKELVENAEPLVQPPMINADEDPSVADSAAEAPSLQSHMEKSNEFLDQVRDAYKKDPLFVKVLGNPSHYTTFDVEDGLIYQVKEDRRALCIPRVVVNKRRLTEVVLDNAHTLLGHFGPQKTSDYIRRWYWWPTLGIDTEKFCKTCGVCQTTKPRNRLMPGLLHPLPISSLPWESIAMDFVGPFPTSKGFNYLWVVLD